MPINDLVPNSRDFIRVKFQNVLLAEAGLPKENHPYIGTRILIPESFSSKLERKVLELAHDFFIWCHPKCEQKNLILLHH